MSNLTLFAEADGTVSARREGLEATLKKFQDLQSRPDSPIRSIHRDPGQSAETAPIPDTVHPALAGALASRGIRDLYVHQADCFEHVIAGRNVVVITPTASGKTLCYNLPVLNRLLSDPGARAAYLFPTKALAEDQLHEFNGLVESAGAGIRAFTYDGDTPQDARRAIRERAQVVLTNPDMLHTGILPHHTK